MSIIVDGDENAAGETARHLLYDGSTASGVRVQTGGGCTLTDRQFFFFAVNAAIKSGFARDSSVEVTIGLVDGKFHFTTTQPNGSKETVTIDATTGDVEFSTSDGCAGTGTALVDGAPIGDGAGTDDDTGKPAPTDDDSTSEAGGESDTTGKNEDSGTPWGPVVAFLALLAAITALAVKRSRTKKDCKPEEEALDSAIIAAKSAHEAWKPLQAALDEAIANDASDAVVSQAQAAASQAAEAADRAQDTVISTRSALQACKGAADEGDPSGLGVGTTRTRADTPDPEPEDGDTPSDPESPSVYGEADDPVDPEEKCREGNEKVLPDPSMPAKTFTVPIGNITIRSSMQSRTWTRAIGGKSGLTPAAFGDLTESDIEDALVDFDDQSRKIRIHPKIPIAVYTVECGYVHRCSPTGEWIKTDEIGQYKTTRTVSSLSIGNTDTSTTKDTAVKHVQDAQAKLNELLEEQDAYDNFECG